MTTPPIISQPEELADLGALIRPDIDRDDLRRAIQACATAGWTWPRTLVEVARMLASGDEPRDLRAACLDPTKIRRITR